MAAQTSAGKGAKIGGFFKGVKAELKKVSWPNKKQLVNYTTVVLVSCGLMALLVWLLDTIAHQLLKFILG
ncbi:preprotein translocase subunit SecE [Caloranaerobacter azorensis DSM 13643]|uniref:Protein translocase subunit SecE n=1 Tax=Caloranaerobacter azorensis DSM 13643 TaxID=1121264 RepID=A0A1M5WKR9_9FIRM|nr:preprotein translocase subunit SecE [Caloranaerobacter azorensis]SHH87734.1 preprotein translocase subunit SecE [Caloranaerobacter azorensis DSM 13643]